MEGCCWKTTASHQISKHFGKYSYIGYCFLFCAVTVQFIRTGDHHHVVPLSSTTNL